MLNGNVVFHGELKWIETNCGEYIEQLYSVENWNWETEQETDGPFMLYLEDWSVTDFSSSDKAKRPQTIGQTIAKCLEVGTW